MRNRLAPWEFALLFLAAFKVPAAELTETETRWLRGAQPVLAYARQQALPLDIIVQPQPASGASPLALAIVDGRCKLVLTMRQNPEARAILDRVSPDLLDAAIELMAAHELGHCRRYLDGAWTQLPAGFADNQSVELPADLRAAYLDMRATRREEGYGDLVGLAWTQRHHPREYPQLLAWLVAERVRERIPGSHHDTLAWLRLATNGVTAADSATVSIFDAAAALWMQGLDADD